MQHASAMFSDLHQLTTTYIEDVIGLRIAPTALAPLLYKVSAELQLPCKQLDLPYGHACVYVDNVIKMLTTGTPRTVDDVMHLPVLFWQHAEIQCLTADSKLVFALRSNATRNAAGKAVTLAAGFMNVVNGMPETAIECGKRELFEETALLYDMIAADVVLQGAITNKAISTFLVPTLDIDGKPDGAFAIGRTPSIAYGLCMRTALSATELIGQIKPNHEALGYVAIDLDDYICLNNAGWHDDLGIKADFWPSSACRLVDEFRQAIDTANSLSRLTRMLQVSAKRLAKGQHELQVPPLQIAVVRADFENHEAPEYMPVSIASALELQQKAKLTGLCGRPKMGL